MNVSTLLKQLKKRLRKKRGVLSLGAWCLLIGTVFAVIFAGAVSKPTGGPAGTGVMPVFQPSVPDSETVWRQLKSVLGSGPDLRTVTLRKVFLCGEENQMLGTLAKADILALSRSHPNWQLESSSGQKISFVETIRDLSPGCKQTAYFGLDKNGNLSLFDGNPKLDQVIRTFFPLNLSHLRTSLPPEIVKELYEGIRVKDLEEYNSILSTFSEFSLEPQKS